MPDVKFSNLYPYTDFHELNLDWVIETVKHWADLVGKTIQSITLTGTTGLVDTYTINYSDGTTSTFTVTNGRGITSIVLTGSLDLVDIYTITYNDGTTSTFQIHNGNGISSIEKTGTSGLIDTYTITFTDGSSTTFEVKNGAEALDATLSLAGYAADAKATGDALALKQNAADPAGLAENLTPYSPDSGATQNVPFIIQGTGCGNGESVVDTGSDSQIQNKNGNSAGVNQLFPDYPDSTNTIDGVTITAAGGYITLSGTAGSDIFNAYELMFTPVSGRKYLIIADATGTPAASGTTWQWYLSGGGLGLDYEISRKIYTAADNSPVTMRLAVYNGVTVNIKSMMPRVIDLSLWFGSTSNIPAHLLSHPEDFGRYYSGSLAYNPGQLVNSDGSVLTSIGRNCWNGQYTANTRLADYTTGATEASAGYNLTDYIPLSPNTAYYHLITASIRSLFYDADKNVIPQKSWTMNSNESSFIAPSNAYFVRFSITNAYISGFTISRYYAGESGYSESYPYTVLAHIDTGSETLRSAGAVADEKTPDGTITRRVGVVDLGTLTWTLMSGTNPYFRATVTGIKAVPTNTTPGNVRAPGYVVTYSANMGSSGADKTISVSTYNDRIYLQDATYATAEALTTALSGIMLYYELATPTTEQGTPFSGASADNFSIDDFGSMYWDITNGIPQGLEIFYPVDYKAAIDTLLNLVDGDVSKIVTTDTYPPAPTANGTYVLKATVSGGTVTYSWVLE